MNLIKAHNPQDMTYTRAAIQTALPKEKEKKNCLQEKEILHQSPHSLEKGTRSRQAMKNQLKT